MKFPIKEAEIVKLATAMIQGLADNMGVYPSPPVDSAALAASLMAFNNAQNAVIAATAVLASAVTAKEEALADLIANMRSDINYAENTVKGDSDKLKLIGWDGRRHRKALTAPGQSRLLEAPKQGDGWVYLDWKAPLEGGKPSAYKVMRRERPEGPWEDVATAVTTEATLVDQPKGKELEYNIIAINKAGEGEVSNTVMVVL